MKYTAKPVTQYARNKKAAMSPFKAAGLPVKDHNALENKSENTSSNSKTSIQRQGGKLYEVTTNNESQSYGSEANKSVTVDKAIAGGTPGTPWEKSIQRRIKEGATDVQLADAGHGTLEGLNKKFKKDFDSQRASKEKGNSKSSSTTVKPVMTEAVAPKTQVQTRAHEKRSSNRQWITSNAVNRIAASSQIRRAKRDGLFADGELTDKGRSSLSPEQQKGLSGAYDTKRGRNADQLAHANRTGKWSHGGNTHAGEKFVTEEGKASEHMRATGSEQEYTGDVNSTSTSSSSNSVGKYKMNRLHSSKSPAKMWNTDASPAKKREPSAEYQEARRAKNKEKEYKALKFMDAIKENRAVSAENAGDDGRALRTRNKKTFQGETGTGVVKNQAVKKAAESPANMWGRAKVKAGKNGFNRKK